MLSKASNSYSNYLKLPNEDFETKVKGTIAPIETHQPNMADYGSTQEQVEDVKLDFDIFLERRSKPLEYRIASSIAAQSLENMFRELALVLGRLDNVMNRFKRSDTNLYNGYIASRKTIDK